MPLWPLLLGALVAAQDCPKAFDSWVGPKAKTVLFVNGVNPSDGEIPSMRGKCAKTARNFAIVQPGKAELADSTEMVREKLAAVKACVTGELTVLCHSKGCDPVANALREEDPDKPLWHDVHVVLANPLIPGGDGAVRGPLVPDWIEEICPKAELRQKLYGKAAAANFARAKSAVVMETAEDDIVADREEYPGEWLAADSTLIFSQDHRINSETFPVDRASLAVQFETDVTQLKEKVIYGPKAAHVILLFLNDLLERAERLRPAKRGGARPTGPEK